MPRQERTAVRITTPFDEVFAKRLMQPGVNSVKGNAFMRQRGGGVVTCAGAPVSLIPATGYARERMAYIYGTLTSGTAPLGPSMFTPDPQEYRQLTYETRCDSQGNFIFDRVADGEFYVVTGVVWETGARYAAPQGGYLMRRVSVLNGQQLNVVLSP